MKAATSIRSTPDEETFAFITDLERLIALRGSAEAEQGTATHCPARPSSSKL
jgi:hypothetical protein